jgi:hypothetical protein
MTTLHDRLTDLAEDAPAAVPATGLWDRGTRYRRRQLVASSVVGAIALVALAVLASATWLRSPDAVQPLPASSPRGMPDRLYAASPWLRGTDDGGPLGRIAAVEPAIRKAWSGSESNGLVGVSAVTGEYRFLDLPGWVQDPFSGVSWALSPDGRYVAYLYRAAGADAWPEAATGLALYDARTGEVRRHGLSSPRGIRGFDLLWAGNQSAVLAYGNLDEEDGSGSRAQPVVAWDVHVAAPQVLESQPATIDLLGTGAGFVVMRSVDGYAVVDTGTGTELRRLGKVGTPASTSRRLWDDTASRFAVVLGQRSPGPISVGTVAAQPGIRPSYLQVPGSETVYAASSWIDDDHLSVLQLAGPLDGDGSLAVDKVDIRSGETEELVTYGDGAAFDAQLATDLLSEPTVRAVEPPRPLDPRKVTGGAAAIELAAVGALIAWRRRVRP